MKCKNTIIAEMVLNAACVMEDKAEFLEILAEQYDDTDAERAARIRKDIPRILEAVELIREFGGCWA